MLFLVIPIRSFRLSAQNIRVSSITSPSLEGDVIDSSQDVIEACYRQIFFHAMKSDRDQFLESQYRNGSITVRDFIRGLLLSERFQNGYISCSDNYRLVEQVVGRVLGRSVIDQSEKLAYSVLIASQGFECFVDEILNSDEYMMRFGYDKIPAQMARKLPGREVGEIPVYQKLPRYSFDWQEKLVGNGLMMSIEDHLSYGLMSSFAERLVYKKPSDAVLKYAIPVVIVVSLLIALGAARLLSVIVVVR